jgi:hypothetical protein
MVKGWLQIQAPFVLWGCVQPPTLGAVRPLPMAVDTQRQQRKERGAEAKSWLICMFF